MLRLLEVSEMPPPEVLAELPLTVQLAIVNVPLLTIAPPQAVRALVGHTDAKLAMKDHGPQHVGPQRPAGRRRAPRREPRKSEDYQAVRRAGSVASRLGI